MTQGGARGHNLGSAILVLKQISYQSFILLKICFMHLISFMVGLQSSASDTCVHTPGWS